MSSEQALAAAREDGLTLIMAPATKTGYKGVSRGGKSSKKPYQAVRGSHSLGYYSTAEEVTLTNPTPTPNPNPDQAKKPKTKTTLCHTEGGINKVCWVDP